MYTLKLAFRRLWRTSTTSLLQIAGLASGMAACMLIGLFAQYERSYDQQSPYAPYIWRAFNQTADESGMVTADANTHSLLGPSLAKDLPEVTAFTRLFNHGEAAVTLISGEKPQNISNVWMCDTGFVRMFPQHFLSGAPSTCLRAPFQMVLTQSTAQRLFSNKQALGQTIKVPGGAFAGLYTVSAIVADAPQNTHLKFNVLASYETRHAQGHADNWDDYWEYTYFQLRPGADTSKACTQLASYSTQFLTRQGIRLGMQRFSDIHLHSNLTYEIEPNGKARTVYFLTLVGAFILLLALINYINLSTAQALRRAAEVGVRKIIGATRSALIWRFMLEGILLCSTAVGLAFLATNATLPWFSAITGRPLDIVPGTAWFLCRMSLGLFAVALLLGTLYPAVSLSAFKPSAMTAAFSRNSGNVWFRKSLIVFQFSCAVALIAGILVIGQQLSFLQHHDKGLALDQVLAIKMPGYDWRQDSLQRPKLNAFKQEILQAAGVASVSASNVVPTLGVSTISGSSSGMFCVKNPGSVTRTAFYGYDVEKTFYPTYGIRFLAGEPYIATDDRSGNQNIVINETAARALGFNNPASAIGEEITYITNPGYRMKIHGVVADFHIESLKTPTRPTFYYSTPVVTSGYFSILLDSRQTQQVLSKIQEHWQQFFPESTLESWFLQERFAQEYQSERQLGRIFGLLAVLAVFIACLGLFGLAAFAAQRRTKEIGVRKVLGASVTGIVTLLATDFLKLVLIAIVIAVPVAWYFSNSWLEGFAYRMEVPWWVFIPAGGIALLVACLAVGVQSIRAAVANPVESLRSE